MAEKAQRAYIATMAGYVQLDNIQKVETYLRSKYYAAFAPYISKVTYLQTDADGSVKALEFEEPTALERALDNLQLADGINLPEVISNYISDKTLTTIAYTHHPCPVCGKMPPDAVNGLAPCDPEYSFFVWTMAKLRL
ncbi:MAG: hypothetical protein K2H85_10410, partial [Allobaculum sp.]|nr:hypothetical protein [Allobaculum sp.]